MAARHPFREWFWRTLGVVFVPIARFVERRRMLACGCFACELNLRRPEIERALVRQMAEAFEPMSAGYGRPPAGRGGGPN